MVAANVLGLGEEGELKAQMLNKPQMLIEVQMFNSALLPLFCQTHVSGSLFFLVCHTVSNSFGYLTVPLLFLSPSSINSIPINASVGASNGDLISHLFVGTKPNLG